MSNKESILEKASDTIIGIRCGNCGEFTPFPEYVAEHIETNILFSCVHCDIKHIIEKGKPKIVRQAVKSGYDDDDYWWNLRP